MLQLKSSWHGRSMDPVFTYSGRQITDGSHKPSRITRQKTCCSSESNTSVRVVFANRSGFDAPIGVFLAWEERGSYLNIFRRTNHGQISETFTNYEAKDLLRNDQTRRFALYFSNRSGFDAPIGVVLAWEERGSCLNIFRMRNRGWISENHLELRGKRLVAQVSQTRRFTLYLRTGVVLMLQLESSWHGRIVDDVLTYSGRQIAVGSKKPSQITRQKTCCASESYSSVHVVFANRSGFDAPIGVVLASEERGSCLNIFRLTNRGRISETFTNYEAKDLLRKNLHELRGKRLVAQVSQIHRFALFLQTGVVLMVQLESSWLGRSVDHVLTYSRRQIAVGSQKPSRITRQKTCCASESNTSVRVVFANRSGFDAPIGVVLALEERGSCVNIFWTTYHGRISETFTNYEAKDLLRRRVKHVDDVLTYSERQIAVGSQKLLELRGKRLVAQVIQTRRFAFYLRTVVVLMLQLESSWHGRSNANQDDLHLPTGPITRAKAKRIQQAMQGLMKQVHEDEADLEELGMEQELKAVNILQVQLKPK
ncbi:hypothetical protein G2W53_041666 [Senna tora]|uniref:Uncharacterized protein n=1 Tax=Senna tora TaxID=362788 RepID=A0A834SE40_9FABA|nr:hypothetical protein G2W53_041666 [Senna tora]